MANLSGNLVDTTVDDKLKGDIVQAVKIVVQLMPFLIEMTKEERKGKKAVQDHFMGFCVDMHKAMSEIPRCKPERVDLGNLKNDTALWDLIKTIFHDWDTTHRKLADTQLAAGHEAYQAAKLGYGTLELLGKSGDTECMTRYKDIQSRYFAKISGPRKKKGGDAESK